MTIKVNVPKRPEPTMKLVYENSGIELLKGDCVTTFRGERGTLTGWREPRTENSTGRVYVKLNDSDFGECEWFPSVIGAKFVPLNKEEEK